MAQVRNSFNTVDEAWAWVGETVNDPYTDNCRFAFEDDPAMMKQYAEQERQGCCGYFDARIMVGRRLAVIGCNYGH